MKSPVRRALDQWGRPKPFGRYGEPSIIRRHERHTYVFWTKPEDATVGSTVPGTGPDPVLGTKK